MPGRPPTVAHPSNRVGGLIVREALSHAPPSYGMRSHGLSGWSLC